MDAIEVARQHAAALHAAAVAKGVDPWQPYDIACAVARSLELDVESVRPGSVGLKGGRAVFDPKAPLEVVPGLHVVKIRLGG